MYNLQKTMPFNLTLGDLVLSTSQALDLANPAVFKHSMRVAAIAAQLASELELDDEDYKNIIFPALLHDSGISSSEMKMSALQFDLGEEAQKHCIDGYNLFKDSEHLSFIAPIILHHHNHWEKVGNGSISTSSPEFLGNLIHLADRIEISINRNENILLQKDKITSLINEKNGTVFSPLLVDSFLNVSRRESFWLNIESEFGLETMTNLLRSYNIYLTLPQIRDFAQIFADIVDRKSSFTYRHSQGVAATAISLAQQIGFSPQEILKMEIAGLLHDLGKLSIPDYILEKPDKLNEEEMLIMKQHTFYTYHLLTSIDAFKEIGEWGAFHHEKLNGKGYPFGLTAPELPLGARIMAVSDIYQALREERPYRAPLPVEKSFSILKDMVEKGEIDGFVVEKLRETV